MCKAIIVLEESIIGNVVGPPSCVIQPFHAKQNATVHTVSAQISQDHMATAFHFFISKRGAFKSLAAGLLSPSFPSCGL